MLVCMARKCINADWGQTFELEFWIFVTIKINFVKPEGEMIIWKTFDNKTVGGTGRVFVTILASYMWVCLPLGTGASVVGTTMVSSDHFLPTGGADPNVGEDASADTTGDTLGGLGWWQREGGFARPVSSGRQVVSTSYLQLATSLL